MRGGSKSNSTKRGSVGIGVRAEFRRGEGVRGSGLATIVGQKK